MKIKINKNYEMVLHKGNWELYALNSTYLNGTFIGTVDEENYYIYNHMFKHSQCIKLHKFNEALKTAQMYIREYNHMQKHSKFSPEMTEALFAFSKAMQTLGKDLNKMMYDAFEQLRKAKNE